MLPDRSALSFFSQKNCTIKYNNVIERGEIMKAKQWWSQICRDRWAQGPATLAAATTTIFSISHCFAQFTHGSSLDSEIDCKYFSTWNQISLRFWFQAISYKCADQLLADEPLLKNFMQVWGIFLQKTQFFTLASHGARSSRNFPYKAVGGLWTQFPYLDLDGLLDSLPYLGVLAL